MSAKLLLSCSVSMAWLIASQCHVAASSPNIIVFMADDMGMGDTSAFQDFTGNADDVQVHTPQMERLARMGVRFTDAHTPSSRCSPTRYGLLTGRYPWRNRLKHWVLFGSQGDPMIEADRPTIASMLRDAGYRTAMVGKWHVGLRYRQSDGRPAAGWVDADLTQPLYTTPLDHGFDFARFTSRSHGTSGPGSGKATRRKNGPNQNVGPGHIHGRTAVGATGNGKQLVAKGPDAYVLTKLGSRHSDHAIEFLTKHVTTDSTRDKPFFLYYPSNSNHGPYTPDVAIGGEPVNGAARTKAGDEMDVRHNYIYENDVALGQLLSWLEATDDPRNPGHRMIDNTLVIFTSDNGAEKNSNIATGPFRSHKGSVYEGGHRVPFIVSWPAGDVGDGDDSTPGTTNAAPIALQDLYATFAEIVESPLPNLREGEKGAEDSFSVLAAFRGQSLPNRPPLFFHDHKEAKEDHAASAIRIDSPKLEGNAYDGQWKLFFDASLLRAGKAKPTELYNLADDPTEQHNLIQESRLSPLIAYLADQALLHRNAGGHRHADIAKDNRLTISLAVDGLPTRLAQQLNGKPGLIDHSLVTDYGLNITVMANGDDATFTAGKDGLGISRGDSPSVDGGEAILIRFSKDVLIESAAIVAGTGTCGGFYQVGEHAPLAIYCVDADIDAQDQSGILSDIGVLKAGQTLRFDSSPHFGVEATGDWRLRSLTLRVLD